jgi:hypothetical protein
VKNGSKRREKVLTYKKKRGEGVGEILIKNEVKKKVVNGCCGE